MKNLTIIMILILIVLCCGCQGLRLGASEQMKQNAFLHTRTAQLAWETARTEKTSDKLCALTELSALQSQAFAADTGMPEKIPTAFTAEQILAEENYSLAEDAITDAGRKIDPWSAADSLFEFGIAVAALFGGAGAVKFAGGLKTAREKSNALKEIIQNNELFKKLNPKSADAFKSAQSKQSPTTKNLVSQLK